MSLSTLHDVPLLRIFYYLPMSDLLVRINLVCHRWNDLYPTACSQRRSLVLLIGEDYRESLAHFKPFGIPFLSELKDGGFGSISQAEDTKFSEWSRVEFSRLSKEKIVRLTSLLSNINSLTWIEYNPTDNLESFQLLAQPTLTDKLVTLALIFPSFPLMKNFDFSMLFEYVPTNFWNGFFGRITELTKLKSLNFYYDHEIGCQLNLDPLIRKLDTLNFYLPDENVELGVWESLRGTNRGMRQLGLLNCLPENKQNSNFDTQLASTFTHLSFNRILNFDIGHFQNVTTVKLSNFDRSRPLSGHIRPLSQLPHLIHVILYFERDVDELLLSFLAHNTKAEGNQLTTVKVLSLHFEQFWFDCKTIGCHLFRLLVKFFPNIRFLSFFAYDYGCRGSAPCFIRFPTEANPPRVMTCLRRWLRTLTSVQLRYPEDEQPKKLSLLTQVEINVLSCNLYRKWSFEEL